MAYKLLSIHPKIIIFRSQNNQGKTVATSTVEDYLKQLYLEERARDASGMHKDESTVVPMGKLASAVGVVPGTATAMVKVLADSGLVRYSPRLGVQLTDAGTQLALHVL